MRVAMYYSNSDIRIEEKPIPKIAPGELLLKVTACGICGSDVMEWYRLHKVPLVLGHEISAIVAEVGAGVKKYKKGDRVCAAHHVPCGKCKYCLNGHETVCETLRKTNFDPGGFAEYLRLPSINVEKGVFLLPDSVSDEEGTFIEPLACVLRGQRQAGVKPGQTVVVIGSGIAGLLHIHLAKVMGAKLVIATDIEKSRLEAAKKFGADVCVNAEDFNLDKLLQVNNGQKADVVILCTGALAAIKQGLESVDRCGSVLFFAPTEKGKIAELAVNDLFWRNEVVLTSSYAASPQDHIEALNLIKQKKARVAEMVTHCLGLKDTQEGFRLVSEAKNSIKVIVNPQD